MLVRSVLFLRKNTCRWPFLPNDRKEDFPSHAPDRRPIQWSLFLKYAYHAVPDEALTARMRFYCRANALRMKLPDCVSVGCVRRYFPARERLVSCFANAGKGLRISGGHSHVGTLYGLLFGLHEDSPDRIFYLIAIVSSS